MIFKYFSQTFLSFRTTDKISNVIKESCNIYIFYSNILIFSKETIKSKISKRIDGKYKSLFIKFKFTEHKIKIVEIKWKHVFSQWMSVTRLGLSISRILSSVELELCLYRTERGRERAMKSSRILLKQFKWRRIREMRSFFWESQIVTLKMGILCAHKTNGRMQINSDEVIHE